MPEIENYQKEKLTIDLGWANVFALILLVPVILVFVLPYYLVWESQFSAQNLKHLFSDLSAGNAMAETAIAFGAVLMGLVIHELIHGIIWAIFAKSGFKAIKFGIFWKTITPYCHCKKPLMVYEYILGAIMPAIVLGIIPAILAIVVGNIKILSFGAFFTMAAAGDFLIIHQLRNEKKGDMVLDHPSEAGCYVYRKVNN
jgi:hypothetical protein